MVGFFPFSMSATSLLPSSSSSLTGFLSDFFIFILRPFLHLSFQIPSCTIWRQDRFHQLFPSLSLASQAFSAGPALSFLSFLLPKLRVNQQFPGYTSQTYWPFQSALKICIFSLHKPQAACRIPAMPALFP